MANTNFKPRAIHEIATEIKQCWPKVYFGAAPYLNIMLILHDPTDTYGRDSARSIINYFLANASTWRGEDAKRIKLELKSLLK